MGYNFTIQGWYRPAEPVDLRAILDDIDAEMGGNFGRPEHRLRATGRRRDYLLAATDDKRVGQFYKWFVTLADHCRRGTGMVVITGEVLGDGFDRILLLGDRDVQDMVLLNLYGHILASPAWTAVHRWSHYMGREPSELHPPDAAGLTARLAGRTSVKGWVNMPFQSDADAHLARRAGELEAAHPSLAGGVAWSTWMSEPYLLVGQSDADATAAVEAVAGLTARVTGSYALLFAGTPDEASQIPVAIEAGGVKVLEPVGW